MKVGGEKLYLSGNDGKTKVSGITRIYYKGYRNIVISADAVEKFFEKYGHEKASYELLKYQKEWLEAEIKRVKELIKFGYDIQSFRDELAEYKSDLKLVEALLEELEKKLVKELSEEEEESIYEEYPELEFQVSGIDYTGIRGE
ncbi:hypothetical protein VFC49_09290 [Thermococcus sp. SY098]|uniref:hypothetical protein n=1 Tax=Thermococcus sp. SY098 TaxID=3111325 RepID=UPI002D781C56|nr:hypothetical protein [Thermococcus sp. SY098]WRS52240.1 hypothetical protein VFC49_09290 [Thermococcus sp. SY098]